MFHVMKVSCAEMTVCKTIFSENDEQSVPEDYHQSLLFIEKNNLVKGQKGENGTKGERGDKGEKGDIGQINQTEINQLKYKITGWIVHIQIKLCHKIVEMSNYCHYLNNGNTYLYLQKNVILIPNKIFAKISVF